MKRLCAMFILAASASMLHADYSYNNGNYNANYQQGNYSQGQCPNQGRCPQNQCPYQQRSQNGQGYSNQNYYNQGYNQPNTMQDNYANGSQNDQLQKNIEDSLKSSNSNKYNNVKVNVNGSNVTLTGSVANQDDRSNLEQKVRGVQGVTNVNNQVKVQNQGQGSSKKNY